MTDALFIARDGLLQTESAPMSRAEAGELATRLSVEAGKRGEPVAMPDGLDRFTVRRAPAATAAPLAYDTLHVEAALCLWEAMIDARLEASLPAVCDAFEAAGSVTMRHHAISLAPYVLAVHDAIPEEDREGHAYDFAIVPAILATIIWRGSGYILRSVDEAAAIARAALQAEA
jgi:hypothetical protein